MRKFIIPCSSLLLILTFNALADDNTSGQWSRDRAMDGQNREMPDHFRRTQRENLAMHRGTREYKRASPEKKNERIGHDSTKCRSITGSAAIG
jgi:hypothetical protein